MRNNTLKEAADAYAAEVCTPEVGKVVRNTVSDAFVSGVRWHIEKSINEIDRLEMERNFYRDQLFNLMEKQNI